MNRRIEVQIKAGGRILEPLLTLAQFRIYLGSYAAGSSAHNLLCQGRVSRGFAKMAILAIVREAPGISRELHER
jgi:hypothetical protein